MPKYPNSKPGPLVLVFSLRNTLVHGAGYKKVWANELHPNGDGFAKVTDKFAKVLEGL